MSNDDALDRSQRNPNTTDADGAPAEEGSRRPARSGHPEGAGQPGEPGGVDPDAPGRSVTDTTSPEAVEPNEPA